MHLCAIKTGFEHDALVMSSLISMYSKCGLIAEASQVFELILQRDAVTWNAMIATYAYQGMAAEALKLFDRMTKDGFSPDHTTFLSVLSSCVHKGYLYEGCHYFRILEVCKMIGTSFQDLITILAWLISYEDWVLYTRLMT